MVVLRHALKRLTILAFIVLTVTASSPSSTTGTPPKSEVTEFPSVKEARGRARLLHEAMHATLQIVHHEYYREDEALKIPAATMREVFRELADRQKVELRWLAVNAQAMNVDHKPRDDFEKQAVAELASGKNEFERVDNGVYRLVGTITLTSDCLKCHVPNRTSNRERAAGLSISIPLQKP
ncbi:MAG TPA: DUF3365 domain-containing protein [Pirellulaceae bacterium]|nr:DUF3365 domain-containing protein [Pirellulaceae bacterium]